MQRIGLAAFALALGCQSANIRQVDDAGEPSDALVPDPRDAREHEDAVVGDVGPSPLEDAGPAPLDAARRDLGTLAGDAAVESDAGDGRELAFADDFATNPFDVAGARWTLVNHDETSWRWTGGTLRSGPGRSCVYWGNRLTEPDEPYCDEGPALAHSPAWDVGNGRFTIELDVYAASADTGHRTSMVFLHRETEEEPRWEVDPEGMPTWPNRDHMLEARMVLSGPAVAQDPHVSYCGLSRSEAPCDTEYVRSLATGVWYRWQIETCDDEVRISVVERDTGVELLSVRAPADVAAPADFGRVYLLLGAEDTDKSFDNVRVWRGCTDDP